MIQSLGFNDSSLGLNDSILGFNDSILGFVLVLARKVAREPA